MIETEQYIRKPLYVNALRVTEENFEAAATWSEGTVETEAAGPRAGMQFIKVNVHGVPKSQRQTKAFVGDWLLHTERGFKVYTDNAFRASFNPVVNEADRIANATGTEPRMGNRDTPPESLPQPVEALPTEDEGVEVALERAPIVSDSPTAPPPQVEDGRRVITSEEAIEMDKAEIEELLRSGQAVLAQDLV